MIIQLMTLIILDQNGRESSLPIEDLFLHIEGDLQLDQKDLRDGILVLLADLLPVIEVHLVDVLTLHLKDGDGHLRPEVVHPVRQGATGLHLGGLLGEFIEVLLEDVLLPRDVHLGEHTLLSEDLPLVVDAAAAALL